MEAASFWVSNAMAPPLFGRMATRGWRVDRGPCTTILCVAVLLRGAMIMIAFYILLAAIGIMAVGSVALAERAKHRNKPLAKQGE